MINIIKRILLVVILFLLLIYLLIHFLATPSVCGKEVIFKDKNYILTTQNLCYGGAIGGIDIALVISHNSIDKEVLKTYSNKGIICATIKDDSIHIYTDAKKLYFIEESIYFDKKKINIINIPHRDSKMKCINLASKSLRS